MAEFDYMSEQMMFDHWQEEQWLEEFCDQHSDEEVIKRVRDILHSIPLEDQEMDEAVLKARGILTNVFVYQNLTDRQKYALADFISNYEGYEEETE